MYSAFVGSSMDYGNNQSSKFDTEFNSQSKLEKKDSSHICPLSSLGMFSIIQVKSESCHDQLQLQPYTKYRILLEDIKCGKRWEIERRYSNFEQLRSMMNRILDQPHCQYCHVVKEELSVLQFPPRHFWGSTDPSVVAERISMFTSYLQEAIRIIGGRCFKGCYKVSSSLGKTLHRFLTLHGKAYTFIVSDANISEKYKIACLLDQLCVDRHARCSSLNTIDEIGPEEDIIY